MDVPLDGRVRQHCVFARMHGVFEPCTRLDHLGGYGTLPLKPRFLVASDRSQVARRRRSRLDLVTSGSLNSNSTELEPAWFLSLCPVVMHSPVTGLFRVLLDRFLLPTIRPRFQEQCDWAYPIGSPFSIAMWSDSCAKTLGKYCSCTSASVERASSPPTTRRYEIG